MAHFSYEDIPFYDNTIVESTNQSNFKILESELIQNTIYEDYPVSNEGGAVIDKQMINFKNILLGNTHIVGLITDKLNKGKGIVDRVRKMIDTYFLVKKNIEGMLFLKKKK